MRVGIFLAVVAVSSVAFANPTKDQCVDADTRAQTLRTQGKFHDARAQLDVCTSPSCPAIVRQDCTERLDDVNHAQPSLVFDVKDSSGADVAAANVTMDGQPLLDRITGAAVQVDPGEHDFVITSRGHLPHKEHVVVHEGDKDRRVKVLIGIAAVEQPSTTAPATPPSATPKTPTTTTPTETPETPETPVKQQPAVPGHGQRVAGVVVGIVGIVGLGVGGALAGAATATWQTSLSECSTTACTNRPDAVVDHDNALALANAATATFIAGGVLVAAGIVVYLTAPHAKASAAAWRITPTFGPGASGVLLSGSF